MIRSRFVGPHLLKQIVYATLALAIVYISLHNLVPAIRYNVGSHRHPALRQGGHREASETIGSPSVRLVIASLKGDDVAWASHLPILGLEVLQYVSNDQYAKFHPPKAKGREALMYFTYLHDFYDDLPDVTIFVHADETPWHVEGTLLRNTSFAVSQLDLRQVQQRGYFNLRVTWRAGCPVWIDTTKTLADYDKEEEPHIAEAWRANFGDEPIPDLLGGPCCSQFAVTREAIQRRPKEQYRHSMDWLIQTSMSDSIVGRVWEHMWPRLFTNDTSDCSHEERRSLCEMYKICFETQRELDDYKELWE